MATNRCFHPRPFNTRDPECRPPSVTGGLIAAVEPFDSQEGRLHLVRVEYTDSDGVAEDTVLWEREHGRDLLEPNALPQVQSEASMEPREFDALVRRRGGRR